MYNTEVPATFSLDGKSEIQHTKKQAQLLSVLSVSVPEIRRNKCHKTMMETRYVTLFSLKSPLPKRSISGGKQDSVGVLFVIHLYILYEVATIAIG